MKTTLKLLVAGAVVWSLAGVASAQQIDYYLWIDSPNGLGVPTAGNWSLSASTSAPLGLAAFVVNLDNATTGASVAPRGENGGVPTHGFGDGNIWQDPVAGQRQAFARQHTSAVYPVGHPLAGNPVDVGPPTAIVKNIGNAAVLDATFNAPPNTMVGSAANDGSAFSAGLQVELYKGTYTGSTRVKYSTDPGNLTVEQQAAHQSVNIPLTGGSLTALQPKSAGSVYVTETQAYLDNGGPAGEMAVLPTFAYHVIWTPDIDGDGTVEGDDLNVILSGWGTNVGAFNRAGGDLDGDGTVEGDDLNMILSAWGQTLIAAPGVSPVPEPSAILLLTIGGVGLALYRRRTAA